MMDKPLKGYNPKEYRCAVCNALLIIHSPGQYQYKIKKRGHPTFFFCKPSCMAKWQEAHPTKKYRSVKQ